MACPSDRHFNLNVMEDANMSPQDNIWHLSFLFANGPLTVGDSMMKNDITATVVARNLLIPKDNMILSKHFDELVVQDSLAFSVQCVGSVSNMGQRLLVRTHQAESLMAEMASLGQEIRGLKDGNRELHMLANNYSTSMKRRLDQLQEFESRIQSDHQRFMAKFQMQLVPSPSGVLPSTKASHNQSPMLPSFGVPPSTDASHEQPL